MLVKQLENHRKRIIFTGQTEKLTHFTLNKSAFCTMAEKSQRPNNRFSREMCEFSNLKWAAVSWAAIFMISMGPADVQVIELAGAVLVLSHLYHGETEIHTCSPDSGSYVLNLRLITAAGWSTPAPLLSPPSSDLISPAPLIYPRPPHPFFSPALASSLVVGLQFIPEQRSNAADIVEWGDICMVGAAVNEVRLKVTLTFAEEKLGVSDADLSLRRRDLHLDGSCVREREDRRQLWVSLREGTASTLNSQQHTKPNVKKKPSVTYSVLLFKVQCIRFIII